jgi:hypothetical protein
MRKPANWPSSLRLRRCEPTRSDPCDYDVIHQGEPIASVYRKNGCWVWAWRGAPLHSEPHHTMIGALDEFHHAWETRGPPSEARAVAVLRDYRHAGHIPHTNQWHTQDDKYVGQKPVIDILMREVGLQDGDEFEVIVRRTGRRPFGDRRVVRRGVGVYKPETDQEMKARLEKED